MQTAIPPIKSQGIKTKLVPWISTLLPYPVEGRWVEPFMGTGVVAFNLAPKHALLCDTNPHLISFYQSLSDGKIMLGDVRCHLEKEGSKLLEDGESHYYKIRERFNREHHPLDFLLLNRAGFNGMIRFNRKGELNVPFCRKPQRFTRAYITKIENQVSRISKILKMKDFVFKCQDFEQTIAEAEATDLIYCDPPYINRHVDYYNGWNEEQEKALFNLLAATPSRFILSTWHHNDFRENEYIKTLWHEFNIQTRNHFYHVGASERNRNPMVEAIITNYDLPSYDTKEELHQEQLMLSEQLFT